MADYPIRVVSFHLVEEFTARVPASKLSRMTDMIVIGAGLAGVIVALAGANLGARTALVAGVEFVGLAAKHCR